MAKVYDFISARERQHLIEEEWEKISFVVREKDKEGPVGNFVLLANARVVHWMPKGTTDIKDSEQEIASIGFEQPDGTVIVPPALLDCLVPWATHKGCLMYTLRRAAYDIFNEGLTELKLKLIEPHQEVRAVVDKVTYCSFSRSALLADDPISDGTLDLPGI